MTASAAASASKLFINKNIEIIVRLNDSNAKQKLKNQNAQQIANKVNEFIEKVNSSAKNIRAIKKLLSDDIVIYTIDKEEATKLRDNNT